jgi:hypothetical protein
MIQKFQGDQVMLHSRPWSGGGVRYVVEGFYYKHDNQSLYRLQNTKRMTPATTYACSLSLFAMTLFSEGETYNEQ